jgi:hypothetical protein
MKPVSLEFLFLPGIIYDNFCYHIMLELKISRLMLWLQMVGNQITGNLQN